MDSSDNLHHGIGYLHRHSYEWFGDFTAPEPAQRGRLHIPGFGDRWNDLSGIHL